MTGPCWMNIYFFLAHTEMCTINLSKNWFSLKPPQFYLKVSFYRTPQVQEKLFFHPSVLTFGSLLPLQT